MVKRLVKFLYGSKMGKQTSYPDNRDFMNEASIIHCGTLSSKFYKKNCTLWHHPYSRYFYRYLLFINGQCAIRKLSKL